MPGYSLEDCDPIYGDAIDRRVTWKGNKTVEPLAGKPVMIRMTLREADIYAMKFEYE
jgi:hypothetical protein